MSFSEVRTGSDPDVQAAGTVPDTDPREWISVTAAAELSAVRERTVRKWIAAGTVESRLLPSGNRDVRLVRRSSLPLPGPWGSRSDTDWEGEAGPGQETEGPGASGNDAELGQGTSLSAQSPAPTLDTGADTEGPRHTSLNHREPGQGASRSDRDADPVRDTITELKARLDGAHLAAKLHALRATEARRLVEEERERFERERAEFTAELAFLRTQLSARSDAEKELRVLLAHANQTVQALSSRLALPEKGSMPPRRWWQLWLKNSE